MIMIAEAGCGMITDNDIKKNKIENKSKIEKKD